ncbi:probable arabinosyltransferase ARAD1 [Impatiens glandulifera]|uniref:probable arabinosyltransferase ARAD1 n=1 Tax=Impatiens glandulifera TaxID=253017 RepID=UPI001FB174B1|nr:probable arabinosyltransferase ARAD1 [Impatiens glandulifera]
MSHHHLPSRFLKCLIIISIFISFSSLLTLLQLTHNNNTTLTVDTTRFSSSSFIQTREKNITVSYNRKQFPLLKVYMYDLPPEFHFGLLGWKGNVNQIWPNISNMNHIPKYPGGLNSQHSIEYWLTLDLLSITSHTSIRVFDSSQADVFFVPFFSSLSYNKHSIRRGRSRFSLNKILQNRLVGFLRSRKEWKRFNGRNHLIVAHHPNSMRETRRKLGSSMFVLADLGRYSEDVANIEKDVIAPYKHMVKTIDPNLSLPFEKRTTLVYFQGAILRKNDGAIRHELFYLLKDEKDVHFSFGTTEFNGINLASKGMAASKFCLNIAGDTPSSNRLFDAIASHCVPVIISDEIELPFEDVLDYSEFCIFVLASDASKEGFILNLLRGVNREEWTGMWVKLKSVAKHFEYGYPTVRGDAVNMVWDAVWRKKYSIFMNNHRNNRYQRFRFF